MTTDGRERLRASLTPADEAQKDAEEAAATARAEQRFQEALEQAAQLGAMRRVMGEETPTLDELHGRRGGRRHLERLEAKIEEAATIRLALSGTSVILSAVGLSRIVHESSSGWTETLQWLAVAAAIALVAGLRGLRRWNQQLQEKEKLKRRMRRADLASQAIAATYAEEEYQVWGLPAGRIPLEAGKMVRVQLRSGRYGRQLHNVRVGYPSSDSPLVLEWDDETEQGSTEEPTQEGGA